MRRTLLVGAFAAALVPAALAAPVSFRGLDFDALGSASALIWSPRSNVAELRCENIGSSGQDGVTVAMPPECDRWTSVFGPVPVGASAPEAFALALHETNDPGLPAFATFAFEPVAGRLRCLVDVPGALDYTVEVWNGSTLVHSSVSVSPPVVDLPQGVTACQPDMSLGVISNLRTRQQELEARLAGLGLLTVNGVSYDGDRVRLLPRCTVGKHFSKVTLTARYSGGGGGGGGAGGFSVRAHATRFGIGGETAPESPVGFVVDDGSILEKPPTPNVAARVTLGPGMTSWSSSYADLSRPASLLRAWGLDIEPIPASSLVGGAQLELRAPSLWGGAPDTLRLLCADDGSGTGSVLHVMNGDGSHLLSAVAYSGSAVLPLAGPAASLLDVPVAEAPTGFHAVVEGGDLVVRCPMPAGAVVFSGGLLFPCDSVEVRVRGGAGEACAGLLACTLGGQQVTQCDVRKASMHHIHASTRRGGVAASAVGDAVLQRVGGDLVVHGMSATGEDGVVLHGGGGALRVRLKGTFSNGDIPDQQQFAARATLADGSTEDVSTLGVVYTPDAGGTRIGVRVHGLHLGDGRLFVQLSDTTVSEPGDCDDQDDGFMDFRQVLAGGTSMVGSVAYRRDSPWTEVFDVGFSGPVLVAVKGADREITGFRVWRNRGGEPIGTEAPRVSALRVTGRPPGSPVLGPQGVCGLEIEGVDLHSAGPGIEAHGPNGTIDGHPVVATWAVVTRDTTGGVDDDCDGGDDDFGITLKVANGGHTPVVIDKLFPPAGPGGPVRRGLAFTGDFGAVDAACDSASFEMTAGGSVLGAPVSSLYRFGGKKGYDYYKSTATIAAATSPLIVRCYLGGALVAEFEHPDSLELTHRPGAVVVGDLDRDGRPDLLLTKLPPGTMVRSPVGGCCTDQDCDRIVISPSAGYDASELDGSFRVSLSGLPPGVPVSGVRLATIPDADPTLGVAPGDALGVFALARPWPNPARGALRARFALPVAAQVRARVFDLAGRVVATLADARFAAGEHELAWDGRADGGGVAPAGLYFLRVSREGLDALSARFTRLR